MSFSAYQATIAFDDAVRRHGYDSEEAIQARNAAGGINSGFVAEIDFVAPASKKPGQGAFCRRFPNSVAKDKDVSPQLLLLLGKV